MCFFVRCFPVVSGFVLDSREQCVQMSSQTMSWTDSALSQYLYGICVFAGVDTQCSWTLSVPSYETPLHAQDGQSTLKRASVRSS